MSKYLRDLLCLSPLRGVAFASLLGATLVGFVGCAGGSNPFCCDSKEKNKVEANLERAQSLDENLETPTPIEKEDEEAEETEQPKTPLSAGVFPTDGSGDALASSSAPIQASTPKTFADANDPTQETPGAAPPQTFADANVPAQEMPVTSSARDVAPNALVEAPVIAAPSLKLDEATSASAATDEPAANVAEQEAAESADAEQDAPESANGANENADPQTQNPRDAANPETPNAETPVAPTNDEQDAQKPQDAPNSETSPAETPAASTNAARRPASPLRRSGGPQRAATRQVAQRGSAQTVAVPQTRGVATATLPSPVFAPISGESATGATVVKIRTRMFIP